MPKFKKKPVVVEAFQMTLETRWDNSDWPEWLNRAWNTDPDEPGGFFCSGECNDQSDMRVFLQTLEGVMRVREDDWIIQGVEGELYSCKPEIFDKTYEPADV